MIEGFDKEETKKLAEWVKLRNIVAHEYLDIRWASIKKFVQESEPSYKKFFTEAKKYLKAMI